MRSLVCLHKLTSNEFKKSFLRYFYWNKLLKNIGCARRIYCHIYIFILNFESAFYHELGNKSSNLIFFLSKIVGMVSGGKEKLLSASASVALLYPRTRIGVEGVKGLFPTTSPHSEDDTWAAPKGALCANTEFHRFSDMTFFPLDHFPLPACGALNWKKYKNTCVGSPVSHWPGMVVTRYLRSARELVSRSLGDLHTGLNAPCRDTPWLRFQQFSHLSSGL